MKKNDDVIQDQLAKGVIEKVGIDSQDGIKHYLPHHAVINPTKLRVVYDASAKTRQTHQSLNGCLYRGPVMLHDLCGILLRFRLHNVALVADIEKAFLKIGLQHAQRDVTSFSGLKTVKIQFLRTKTYKNFALLLLYTIWSGVQSISSRSYNRASY